MLDVADCHDLTSLQVVLCLVIFLQASSMLSTCYSYICAGVAASLRMGLHSPEALEEHPPEERQSRRCVFAVLHIMVGTEYQSQSVAVYPNSILGYLRDYCIGSS